MNIKEYISSGIIESYVLGLSSEHERFEFEQLCTRYPELLEARINFEQAFEKQAIESAEAPPAYCKEKIWSALQQVPASDTSKIITMESTTTRKTSAMRWVVAASIILLLAAGYFVYDFYNQTKKLKDSNEDLKAGINQRDSILNIVNDPHVTVVNMAAMIPGAPSANIYWDTTSSDVYLIIKNMPKLASENQYQLWSLIDSNGMKPTSLGLFDGGTEKIILRMNNAQKADAFAITIEKRGNSGGPDLKQLQTMGKTKL